MLNYKPSADFDQFINCSEEEALSETALYSSYLCPLSLKPLNKGRDIQRLIFVPDVVAVTAQVKIFINTLVLFYICVKPGDINDK